MAKTTNPLSFCFFIGLFLLISPHLHGQQFFRTYEANQVIKFDELAVDAAGRHLGITRYFTNPTDQDFFVVCTDDQGDTLWARTYGTLDSDYAFDACPVASGGWALVGNTKGFGNYFSLLVIRLDVNGNVLWSHLCSKTGGLASKNSVDIEEGPTGDLWVIGDFYIGGIDWDGMAIRLSPSGNVHWMRRIGGGNVDRSYGMTPTRDGGLVMCGASKSFGNGTYDAFACKFDSSGNLSWSRVYSRSSGDFFFDCAELPNDDLVFSGSTPSNNNATEVAVARMDSAGNLIWARGYEYFAGASHSGLNVYAVGDDIVVGAKHSSTGGNIPVLIVLDSLGTVRTTKIHSPSHQLNTEGMEWSGDSLFSFYGRFYPGPNQFSRAYVWTTDTVNRQGCNDFWQMAFTDTLNLASRMGGTPVVLTWDSAVVIVPAAVETETALHCNNWGGCSLEASFYQVWSGGGNFLCLGDSVQFQENGFGATSLAWYQNGTLFSNDPDPFFIPSDTGTVEIMLIADNGSCQDTSIMTYQVVPVPEPEIFLDGPNPFCDGDTLWMQVSGNYASVVWLPYGRFGNVSWATLPGDYSVRVQDSSGCYGYSDTITLVTLPGPLAQFGYQGNGLTIQFTDQSIGAVNWHWDFGDGNTSGQQDPVHTYGGPGIYSVCLTITDTSGCSAKRIVTVPVGDVGGIAAGFSEEGIKVFPVPASDRVWIEGKGISGVKVRDVLG